jgi:DnaJ domain
VADASHYDLLGVAPTASADEVRAAYRRAARDHHPDAGGDGVRMQDLNAAWRVLGDPIRRAAYDRQRARALVDGDGPDPTGVEDPDDPDVEDRFGPDLDDLPLGQTRALQGWWALLPPATLVAAVAIGAAAFVFSAPDLLALAGGVLVLALGLFVLAPLRAMSRKP